MPGHTQSSNARVRFRSYVAASYFPAVVAHPAPSFASTLTRVPAPHRRVTHAPAPTAMPVPDVPTGPLSAAPEEFPSTAAPITQPAPTTPVAPAPDANPTTDTISMARVISTDAQRST
ncbi:hypothetical protein HETIRDRAFT_109309 [Heterobasidion irregulare TC 32-1]|uniref:Uncharacterized protein n=1 Tax=Heterobasidion irregulare (strain TC 32-1) TaxID=747525 RepID=W4KHN4_HETIT|nr:uncharacterized protein HETIRDRAFT_109309 [Heterobasidion irregulare TC 32-1]ETW84810.1 hypothetical protein HETIRDRAFT_109309 [Heterobasidion irregulare TC 32-1]